MDSLTQIALGAAVGEVVLGKKIGNRALLWGAIGGTIPDLDIMANFVTDEISALAFHRGISHSIFFAVTSAPVFGWLVHRLYDSGLYQSKKFKGTLTVLLLAFILSWNLIPLSFTGSVNWVLLLITLGITTLLGWRMYRRYYEGPLQEVHTSWSDWSWLFFWAIFTHPLLDCCTAYGTQLFQPFSDYRVALNNISVVDPIYTLPLLIGVIIASRYAPVSISRRWLNWGGIVLSSAYLLLTGYHKIRVDRIFEASLKKEGIEYSRFRTSPTIFNNVLWNGVAEGETQYYYGLYSIFDESPHVQKFQIWPKNHNLLDGHHQERDIQILKWFSNGYYNVLRQPDGQLQLNDLRFGTLGTGMEENPEFVFKFILEQKNGLLVPHQSRDMEARQDAFRSLWQRLKGIPTTAEAQ